MSAHQQIISVVCTVHLAKTTAMDLLQDCLAATRNGRASDPVLTLPGGAEITIEVPKFGEDLPLTLDFRFPEGTDAHLPHIADTLDRIRSTLGWDCVVLAPTHRVSVRDCESTGA